MNLIDKQANQSEVKPATFWQKTITNIRRRLATGIITLIPISVTVFILYFIIKRIHQFFAPLVTKLFQIDIPILNQAVPVAVSILLAVIIIYVIGLLSTTYTTRRLLAYGEQILAKTPIIKTLYTTSKQMVDAVTMPQKGAFKKVVAVEFPRPGLYALAFVTSETRSENGDLMVTIFLPTTPNPTTGFALLLPASQLFDVNLSISDGFKWIISAGVVSPELVKMTPYKSLYEES